MALTDVWLYMRSHPPTCTSLRNRLPVYEPRFRRLQYQGDITCLNTSFKMHDSSLPRIHSMPLPLDAKTHTCPRENCHHLIWWGCGGCRPLQRTAAVFRYRGPKLYGRISHARQPRKHNVPSRLFSSLLQLDFLCSKSTTVRALL